MKNFLARYSYDFVKMFLDQFAIAVFGFSLAMTATVAKSDLLLWLSSVGSIIFYLMLIYGVAWKIGYSDRPAIRRGETTYFPFKGALISLCANSINIILAIAVSIEYFTGNAGATFIRGAALLLQAEFMGLLSFIQLGGAPLNEQWWIYFVIILPSVLVSTLGYVLGHKEIHFTNSVMPEIPASDRPTKEERRAARRAQNNGVEK